MIVDWNGRVVMLSERIVVSDVDWNGRVVTLSEWIVVSVVDMESRRTFSSTSNRSSICVSMEREKKIGEKHHARHQNTYQIYSTVV